MAQQTYDDHRESVAGRADVASAIVVTPGGGGGYDTTSGQS